LEDRIKAEALDLQVYWKRRGASDKAVYPTLEEKLKLFENDSKQLISTSAVEL